MSFVGFIQRFNGRIRQAPSPDAEGARLYPYSPPPAVENRNFAAPEDMRTIPTTGPFPVGTPSFTSPLTAASPWLPSLGSEPALSPSPTEQLPTRNLHPDSTTAKGVPLYTQGGGTRLRITPVDVRRGGEQP